MVSRRGISTVRRSRPRSATGRSLRGKLTRSPSWPADAEVHPSQILQRLGKGLTGELTPLVAIATNQNLQEKAKEAQINQGSTGTSPPR